MIREAYYRRYLLCVVAGLLVLAGGCGGYPEVSPAAFELAKAVVAVCNTRQPEQLDKARRIIQMRHEAGDISQREERYLGEILELAEAGRWERAETRARRLLRDQTEW